MPKKWKSFSGGSSSWRLLILIFSAYEFRALSLLTKLIVTLGYGFSDAHINKMLTQACAPIRNVAFLSSSVVTRKLRRKGNEVVALLELDPAQKDQVIVKPGTVKQFLETPKLNERLIDLIPPSKDVPF